MPGRPGTINRQPKESETPLPHTQTQRCRGCVHEGPVPAGRKTELCLPHPTAGVPM